jgi:hypothetical protein
VRGKVLRDAAFVLVIESIWKKAASRSTLPPHFKVKDRHCLALRSSDDFGRNGVMSSKGERRKEAIQMARQGSLLGSDGLELKTGLWESAVYLGADGFVYHITSYQARGGLQQTIEGKRPVGEYLRWVDGLFRPGELPSEANGIHYRAARMLRELI